MPSLKTFLVSWERKCSTAHIWEYPKKEAARSRWSQSCDHNYARRHKYTLSWAIRTRWGHGRGLGGTQGSTEGLTSVYFLSLRFKPKSWSTVCKCNDVILMRGGGLTAVLPLQLPTWFSPPLPSPRSRASPSALPPLHRLPTPPLSRRKGEAERGKKVWDEEQQFTSHPAA